MHALRALAIFAFIAAAATAASGRTFYVDPTSGQDSAAGTSVAHPWRTLKRARRASLGPGDQLLLAAGVRHPGRLYFESLSGTQDAPIVIGSFARPGVDPRATALIDGRGNPAAIGLKNCRHVQIENLSITADGGPPSGDMRCGVFVEIDGKGEYRGISLSGLHVKAVSFEQPGFARPIADVKTPNGRGRYGWGIRFMVDKDGGTMRDISVRNCLVERVDHTGLKFTAPEGGIRDVTVENVQVSRSGGPGIQMSGVIGGHFSHLTVDHSGSTDDSRNWGRGSGLWTWTTSDVIIERSKFTNANGPGDSAGVHIDYNCRNVIVQYNVSAHNAGGFCEILGNNHNCAYRYNVSVNDGWRVKGREGAFQEGKLFWLSGYVGNGPRVGPFNTYFYNNTIYVDESIDPKISVAPTADGVLIANNIFYIKGATRTVAGDQQQRDVLSGELLPRVVFTNNLFLRADNWPPDAAIQDAAPIVGDPRFQAPGGTRAGDYAPMDRELVKGRGVRIPRIPGDNVGLTTGLDVKTDILGNPVGDRPGLGAIELE